MNLYRNGPITTLEGGATGYWSCKANVADAHQLAAVHGLDCKWVPRGGNNTTPPPTDLTKAPRAELLEEALRLVTQDRNNQYGPPTQDFTRAAEILNSLGYRHFDGPLPPGARKLVGHDIAVTQIAVKLSRITWSPTKMDSWTDMAGYSGCGYECVVEETKGNTTP